MEVRPTPYLFRHGALERAHPAVPAAFRGPPRERPLSLTAAETDAQVTRLAQVRVKLNVPFGILARGQRVAVLVNPQVSRVGRNLVNEAPQLTEVFTRAQLQPAELTATVDRLIGLAGCYQAALRGQERLRVSRGLTARALRMVGGEILAAARHLLEVPDLKPELRARLQAGLLPIEAAQSKKKTDEQKRRAATIAANERAQDELERLAEKDVLRKVLDDLRAGRAVDPAEAARAVRTHDELKEERAAAAATEIDREAKAKKAKASNRRGGGR